MSVLGIIGDILSIFGLGASSSDRKKPNGSGSTDVRVERESGDTENESSEHDAGEDEEEPAAAETDAAASTDEMAEATSVTDHAGAEEEAAEPAEAAGPVPTEPEDGAEPVDSVSGIGPAYAKRLNEAGVESVTDLAAADAAELADETGISEKRIRGWQDAAE